MKFGTKLKIYLRSTGVRKARLHKVTGISRGTIDGVLEGGGSQSTFNKIKEAFPDFDKVVQNSVQLGDVLSTEVQVKTAETPKKGDSGGALESMNAKLDEILSNQAEILKAVLKNKYEINMNSSAIMDANQSIEDLASSLKSTKTGT